MSSINIHEIWQANIEACKSGNTSAPLLFLMVQSIVGPGRSVYKGPETLRSPPGLGEQDDSGACLVCEVASSPSPSFCSSITS